MGMGVVVPEDSMIGRVLCWWGIHRKPFGYSKDWAFLWVCVRCSAMCPGDLSKRLKP